MQAALHEPEYISVFQQLPVLLQFQIVLYCFFEAFFLSLSLLFFAQSASFKGSHSAFKKMKGGMKVNYFQKNKIEKQ